MTFSRGKENNTAVTVLINFQRKMPYPLVWRWSAGWGRWLWNGPSVTRFCWPSLHAHIFSTSHPPRDVDLSNTERWALCFSWLCSVHKNAERLSSVPLRSMFCTYKRQTIELLLILLLILGYCSEVVCKNNMFLFPILISFPNWNLCYLLYPACWARWINWYLNRYYFSWLHICGPMN